MQIKSWSTLCWRCTCRLLCLAIHALRHNNPLPMIPKLFWFSFLFCVLWVQVSWNLVLPVLLRWVRNSSHDKLNSGSLRSSEPPFFLHSCCSNIFPGWNRGNGASRRQMTGFPRSLLADRKCFAWGGTHRFRSFFVSQEQARLIGVVHLPKGFSLLYLLLSLRLGSYESDNRLSKFKPPFFRSPSTPVHGLWPCIP